MNEMDGITYILPLGALLASYNSTSKQGNYGNVSIIAVDIVRLSICSVSDIER